MGCSLIGANKEDLQYVGQLCRCIQQQLQRPILEVDVFTGTVLMPCSCTNPGLGPQGASSCHGRRRRTVFHPQFQ